MWGCALKEKKLKDSINSSPVRGKDTISVKDWAVT